MRISDWSSDVCSSDLRTAKFRFISDAGAMVTAMLAGDLDAIPIGITGENVAQFEQDKRFRVTIGSTEGETILTINNKRKPLDDVRVRRAISYAIDRKAIIDGEIGRASCRERVCQSV